MRLSICRAMLCVGGFAVQGADAQAFTLTTINLEWFGLNGTEARGGSIRRHLEAERLFSDVMVFEEIVDVARLEREVVGRSYQCQSYDRSASNHQHVVLCVKEPLRLELADDDTDFELEAIDLNGHLRPAVHGVLKDSDGKRLAHIFGVHLKASPESSDVRMNQVDRLISYIQRRARDRIVILGDFNTFEDDPEQMARRFATAGLSEVGFTEPFTWAAADSAFEPAKFDRVWASTGFRVTRGSNVVVGPCSSGDQTVIRTYNRTVSDHCAVTVELH